ncbi:MAG: translation initiation factor IF-3 [Candidatus Omnitrophota bacterium]
MVIIEKKLRINEKIRIPQTRLIGPEGEQVGVVPIEEALKRSKEALLDLVEIAPLATPPVCRIMDFSKYVYEQEKREKEARKNQHIIHIKEIRLKPKIEENDYQVKLRHVKEFLQKKNKVKVTMIFRGRELAHIDIGKRILDRLITDVSPIGEIEKSPVFEGRSFTTVFLPK